MSAFEFTFSLFGLMLGFTLVEVLQGLVKTLKLRGKVKIGWLTPLIGLFVMVDLTSFWSIAWQVRDTIPANFPVLLLGLAITSLYYFSASMVFPDKPEEWPDFDLWTDKHKRLALGGIFACNILTTAAVFAPVPFQQIKPFVIVTNVGLLAAMGAATFVKPRWATGGLIGGILLFYFLYPALATYLN